jgi:hypothetical protein
MTNQSGDSGSGSIGNSGSSMAGTSGSTGSMAGGHAETCTSCGRSMNDTTNNGLDAFLGKIGISDDMLDKIKGTMQNVDVEEYLNTARDYIKDSSGKAKSFTKENPGKVAAGVAVLAVGAGLLLSALNRDKE